MNFVLLGWFRPVTDRNAETIVRFRPSCPTANSFGRICPSVPQLPHRPDLGRVHLRHFAERLVVESE